MKYLFVKENPWMHGANLTLHEMASLLFENGHEVEIISPFSGDDYNAIVNEGSKTIREFQFDYPNKHYDVVVANEALALSVVDKLGIAYDQIFAWMHNDFESYRDSYSKIWSEFYEVLRNPKTKIITTNDVIYNQWKDQTLFSNIHKVIAPVIVPSDLSSEFLDYPYYAQERIENYVFTGSARPKRSDNKGNDHILEIIESLISDESKTFTILGIDYGSGTEFDSLVDKYPKQVILTGHLSRKELLKVLSESDLFISTSKFEATQRIMIESMMVGTFAISRENAGSLALFGEHSTLIYHDIEDFQEMSYAYLSYIKDLYEKENIDEIMKRFSPDSILVEWNKVAEI